MKKYTETPKEYIYWDDPKVLKDRLKLLKAAEVVGNDNVHKDIISIEEELQKEKENRQTKETKKSRNDI